MDISILDQYRNTNVEKLIDEEIKVSQDVVLNIVESVKNDVLQLRNASGDVLDMWGKLLNFSRMIPVKSTFAVDYDDFSFFGKNFFRINFHNFDLVKYKRIEDEEYRKILTILLVGQNLQINIESIFNLMKEVLKQDLAIRDEGNMSFALYYYFSRVPFWINFVLQNYDIIPRPAGVQIKLVDSSWKVLAFDTQDLDWFRRATAFWNGQFLGNRSAPPYRVSNF